VACHTILHPSSCICYHRAVVAWLTAAVMCAGLHAMTCCFIGCADVAGGALNARCAGSTVFKWWWGCRLCTKGFSPLCGTCVQMLRIAVMLVCCVVSDCTCCDLCLSSSMHVFLSSSEARHSCCCPSVDSSDPLQSQCCAVRACLSRVVYYTNTSF
jgi:hypothetical protein